VMTKLDNSVVVTDIVKHEGYSPYISQMRLANSLGDKPGSGNP
jgi:hypothetical protein